MATLADGVFSGAKSGRSCRRLPQSHGRPCFLCLGLQIAASDVVRSIRQKAPQDVTPSRLSSGCCARLANGRSPVQISVSFADPLSGAGKGSMQGVSKRPASAGLVKKNPVAFRVSDRCPSRGHAHFVVAAYAKNPSEWESGRLVPLHCRTGLKGQGIRNHPRAMVPYPLLSMLLACIRPCRRRRTDKTPKRPVRASHTQKRRTSMCRPLFRIAMTPIALFFELHD